MTNNKGMEFSGQQAERLEAPRSLRIIVADDDRDTVLTLMMVLRHEGHDARGAYKGTDVLKLVREFDADVILLDINMPPLSGYDVARVIRQRKGEGRPLLIGISGVYKQGSDRVLAKIVGFDHYLIKPYEPSDVLRLLEPLRSPSADA